jgi:hypothetical protein
MRAETAWLRERQIDAYLRFLGIDRPKHELALPLANPLWDLLMERPMRRTAVYNAAVARYLQTDVAALEAALFTFVDGEQLEDIYRASVALGDEARSVWAYLEIGHEDLNRWLRSGRGGTPELAAMAADLDAIITRFELPASMVVHRWIKGGEFPTGPLPPGTIITDHGFVSTGYELGALKEFAVGADVRLELTVPQGLNVIVVNGLPGVLPSANEREILLPRGVRFLVESDNTTGDVRVITATVLPPVRRDVTDVADPVDRAAAVVELPSDAPTFRSDPVQPTLESYSSAAVQRVLDAAGEPHLFKAPTEQYLAEIEHAAHLLAALVDLSVAESRLGVLDGAFGQYQAWVPHRSTLEGVDVRQLPLTAWEDLVRAHVQDYATSNDDAVGRNFLLSPDGRRAHRIDLARSFARFGVPGAMSLQVGYLSGWETPYYDGLYTAILDGLIGGADVDRLHLASMEQARWVRDAPDSEWVRILAAGLAKRPDYADSGATGMADMLGLAVLRKKAIVDEFALFWEGIYAQLGRPLPPTSP